MNSLSKLKPKKLIGKFSFSINQNEVYRFKQYLFYFESINSQFKYTDGNVRYNSSDIGVKAEMPYFELHIFVNLKKNAPYLPLIVRFYKKQGFIWDVELFINPSGATSWNITYEYFKNPRTKYDKGFILLTGSSPEITLVDYSTYNDAEYTKYIDVVKEIFSVTNNLLRVKRKVLSYYCFDVIPKFFNSKGYHYKFGKYHIIHLGGIAGGEVIAFCIEESLPFIAESFGFEKEGLNILASGLICGLTLNTRFIPKENLYQFKFNGLKQPFGCQRFDSSALVKHAASLKKGKFVKKDEIRNDSIPYKTIENIQKYHQLTNENKHKIVNALLLQVESLKVLDSSPLCAIGLLWSSLEGLASERKYNSKKRKKKKSKKKRAGMRDAWLTSKGNKYVVYRFLKKYIVHNQSFSNDASMRKLLTYAYKEIRNPLMHQAKIYRGKFGEFQDLNYMFKLKEDNKAAQAYDALQNYFMLAASNWLERK